MRNLSSKIGIDVQLIYTSKKLEQDLKLSLDNDVLETSKHSAMFCNILSQIFIVKCFTKSLLIRKKIIHWYSRHYFKISQDYDHIGGAAMVKWHSPPTNVTRVRSPDPMSYEGRVCWLFSLGSPVFLPPQKPTLLNSNWISYTCTL